MKKLHVIPDDTGKITNEILAKSVKEISEGMKKLRSGGLNDRALTILIAESCGVSRTDVRSVMDAIADLEKNFVRK